MDKTSTPFQAAELFSKIQNWAYTLGFDAVGVTDTNLDKPSTRLLNWLQAGMHGGMYFMEQHIGKRTQPGELLPGTLRILSVRMNYFCDTKIPATTLLEQKNMAYIARYALGRDYHKLMRKRLQKLADQITAEVGEFNYRAFVDSAPVMEKALAENAGLGWIGKHTLNLNQKTGSYYFLGELYTNLPLPISPKASRHCGDCCKCISVCPTQAITAPYQLDARRCIAYLTIEHQGSIPVEFRTAIGNRVFGCDDCQLVCPWNRFAQTSKDPAMQVRNKLDCSSLLELFLWSEEEFKQRTQGSVLYRLGYTRWLRNLAVGLGNAPYDDKIVTALRQYIDHPNAMVREHTQWALAAQMDKHKCAGRCAGV